MLLKWYSQLPRWGSHVYIYFLYTYIHIILISIIIYNYLHIYTHYIMACPNQGYFSLHQLCMVYSKWFQWSSTSSFLVKKKDIPKVRFTAQIAKKSAPKFPFTWNPTEGDPHKVHDCQAIRRWNKNVSSPRPALAGKVKLNLRVVWVISGFQAWKLGKLRPSGPPVREGHTPEICGETPSEAGKWWSSLISIHQLCTPLQQKEMLWMQNFGTLHFVLSWLFTSLICDWNYNMDSMDEISMSY